MGRWTPLILMAGGLAILFGTLLGINFPLGVQQNAQLPKPVDKASRVLPANININSTATGSTPNDNTTTVAQKRNTSSVAQNNNNNSNDTTPESINSDVNQNANSTNSQTQKNEQDDANQNQKSEPIRALW